MDMFTSNAWAKAKSRILIFLLILACVALIAVSLCNDFQTYKEKAIRKFPCYNDPSLHI